MKSHLTKFLLLTVLYSAVVGICIAQQSTATFKPARLFLVDGTAYLGSIIQESSNEVVFKHNYAIINTMLNYISKESPIGLETIPKSKIKNIVRYEPPPGSDIWQLYGLCDYVYQNFEAKDSRGFLYLYEKKIYLAAGLTEEDAIKFESQPESAHADKVRTKIQAMWKFAQSLGFLECDTANFDVPKGSILKYAVKLQNFEFLTTAAEVWKVDLNHIDSSDKLTLLDYMSKEIKRTEGNKRVQPILKGYYKILREEGAKHASEL